MNLQTNNRTADAPPGSLHPVVVPILPDTRIQGEPNGKTKPLTKNIYRAQSAAAGLSLEGGALTHALSPNGNGVGNSLRIRNPEHRAKAERFWENLSAKRKQPGNCCRCGKPHDGEYRQCDKCRVRVAALKSKRQAKGMTLAECVVMVNQCRREVTKLRELIKQVRRTKWNAYNRGYTAGKKHGLEVEKYHNTLPEISKQELATMNHAYDR